MFHTLKRLFKKTGQREYLVEDPAQGRSYMRWFLRFVMGLLVVFAMLFVLIMSDALYADTGDAGFPEVAMQNVSEGSLLIRTDRPGMYKQIPLLHTDVEMQVSGMILRSQLRQTFKNIGEEWVEAVYVFPLPEQAAVDHMRMYLNDRIIEGMIEEKQQARKIFEQAKQDGKKASLVEQQRPNMFSNAVANIAPGEEIVVEIEYQQLVHYEQGRFSLRFPMAITPRYIPGTPVAEEIHITGGGWAVNTDQVADAAEITPPVHTGASSINPVSLRITLNAGFPLGSITSAYHPVHQAQQDEGRYLITLVNGTVASDRDFELHWQAQTGHEPKAAVFNELIRGEHYQLIMLMPPTVSGTGTQSLPREVIYVIDTSGSMAGVSMEQARQALLMALKRLRPQDRFNIIQFNSTTESLFRQAQPASVGNVQGAIRYVQALEANGGTEMAPALRAALQHQTESSAVRQVIFITDGSVGNETALFDLIRQNLGQSRLFTIGIGSAPNSYFMRKAAQHGRGSFSYIGDVSEVADKMSQLFEKLESPVMRNLALEFPPGSQVEVWPAQLPDLYQGEPLLITSKSGQPLDQLTIRGVRESAGWQATLSLQQGEPAKGTGSYWARSKIAALMDSLHDGADKDAVRQAVVEVALSHHLVSAYTSLVAVDITPSRPASDTLNTQHLPVNLPQGQVYEKIFGRLPQTATRAQWHLGVGLVLLLLFLVGVRCMPMAERRMPL